MYYIQSIRLINRFGQNGQWPSQKGQLQIPILVEYLGTTCNILAIFDQWEKIEKCKSYFIITKWIMEKIIMVKLIIYMGYLIMVKLIILKLIMVEIPMKKLIKIKTNHNQYNHIQFNHVQ
jgi:hypothetical protein